MKRPLFAVGFICLCTAAALAFLGQRWIMTAFALGFFLGCAAATVRNLRAPMLAAAAGVLLSATGHLMFYQSVVLPFVPMDGSRQEISGHVISARDYGNYYEYIIEGSIGRVQRKSKLRLITFEDMELELCDAVQVSARFALPTEKYALSYNIRGLAGDIKSVELTAAKTNLPKGWGYRTAAIVAALEPQIEKYIPRTPEIASSMLFSGQVVWERQEYDKMAKAGVAHILAVSGLHLSIAVQGVLLLCTFLRLPKWAAALLGCAVSLIVAAAAGFSPSVSRAAVMSIIMMGAYAIRREHDSLTSLGAAAAVICLFSPYSVLDRGMILSFSSTLSIILFYSPINRWLRTATSSRWEVLGVPLRAFISAIAVWISAQIITLPVVAYFFGYLPTYSLFANLLLAPSVPLLIIAAWGTGILGMMGAVKAATFTGGIADFSGLFISRTVDITSTLPFAALPIRQWSLLIWLACACLSLIILRLYGRERIVPICLAALLLPLPIWGAAASLGTGNLHITACTSGSLILSRAGHSVIIDLPEKHRGISQTAACAGSKGKNIDAITVSGDAPSNAARINTLGDLLPYAALVPPTISQEADGRLDGITLAERGSATMQVLGCADIAASQGKTLVQVGEIRILKLSWGYGIIEDDDFLQGIDVIISPEGMVRSLNPKIVPRRDPWGDINLNLRV